MGFGICGFANTVDTLAAIKYATVKPIRDEDGYISVSYTHLDVYKRQGKGSILLKLFDTFIDKGLEFLTLLII